jgi:hypothetical protein
MSTKKLLRQTFFLCNARSKAQHLHIKLLLKKSGKSTIESKQMILKRVLTLEAM